jgi:hypothetical protein
MCPHAPHASITNNRHCSGWRVSSSICCMCPYAPHASITSNRYCSGWRVSSRICCMCPYAPHASITSNRYCSGWRVSSRIYACVLMYFLRLSPTIHTALNIVCPHAKSACVLTQKHRLSATSICMCPHAKLRVIDAVLPTVCPHAGIACVLTVYQQP